ncbi:hypothetical protein MMYC01_200367 [Madurella mycetomatis]|uniref:Uncharacterized protein n=1 Tax=Madurella mycetomatis TaxID=100816 RepID=A0A175WH26_9PEZI|nr:hypothetical protein MMYC01_200367 [Madurella mycetomatis]
MPGARRFAGWKEESHTPPKVLPSSPADTRQIVSVTPTKRRLSSGQWNNGRLFRRVKVESESDSDGSEWRVTQPGHATPSEHAESTEGQLHPDEIGNHTERGGSCVDDASVNELNNHTEWGGSCMDGFSVDELENHMERDSLGNNSVSADEPSGAEPLKSGSLWNSDPSRKQILLLANCQGLDDFQADGGKPNLTARDVFLSAMASVRFIRGLDRVIWAHDIGIDYAGRLFDPETDGQADFREDFFDMTSKFTENLRLRKQTEMCKSKLAAFAESALEKQVPGLDNRGKAIEYGWAPATKKLQTCAAAMAKDASLDIGKLESVLVQCEEAVTELEAVVTVVTTVTQDLIETKSTSLARWRKLKDMAWLFQVEDSTLLDEMLQRSIDDFIDVTVSNLAPYQRFLRRALTLQEDLDEAIKEAQRQ